MSEPRFQPLLVVEYGEKDREPWMRVAVTTEVSRGNVGWSSRNIYDGPAPRIENELRVFSPEPPA